MTMTRRHGAAVLVVGFFLCVASDALCGAAKEAALLADLSELAKAPVPAGRHSKGVMGPATVVAPRKTDSSSSGGALRVDVTDGGRVDVTQGDQPIVQGEYFRLFGLGKPTRQETRVGELRRITLNYDTPKGTLTKEVVSLPNEVWICWTATAKQAVRGEVGFYCPQAAFKAPVMTYLARNQTIVTETDAPLSPSSYCIIAGGADDPREFQCGTSGSDWLFQDRRSQTRGYRFVAVPHLSAKEQWRAVFRYVAQGDEPYPAVAFDQSREERGILSTLLPDAINDGFTIVPVRAARYTFTNRPLDITMKYYGLDGGDRDVDIECRLIDTWGRQVGQRKFTLQNKGRSWAAIRFPVTLDVNGAYRMEIAYRSGDVSRTRELIFIVLPEITDTGFRPNSVFGAALASGDYIGTLAKRIGLKWNRCHCAIGDTRASSVVPKRGQYVWGGIEQARRYHEKFQFRPLLSINHNGDAR